MEVLTTIAILVGGLASAIVTGAVLKARAGDAARRQDFKVQWTLERQRAAAGSEGGDPRPIVRPRQARPPRPAARRRTATGSAH